MFIPSLAVAGEDFTFSGMLVFQFNGGPSNTACINIGISDDFDFEGDHSFIVSLSEMAGPPIGPPMKRMVSFSSPSGPLIGPNSQTMVTIDDSEGMVYGTICYAKSVANFSDIYIHMSTTFILTAQYTCSHLTSKTAAATLYYLYITCIC